MQKIPYLLLFLLATLMTYEGLAQQNHELTPYTDADGKLYWPKDKPIYLFMADNPAGDNKTKLESKKTQQYTNPFYLDTEGINYIRTRHAVNTKTKQMVLPKIEIMFEVYADGIPPTTTIDLKNSPAYISRQDKKAYYGKDLQVQLTAKDALSGVKDIYIKIGEQDFEVYTETITLTQGGAYEVKYYAVDNVGNAEELHHLQSKSLLSIPNRR